MVQDRLKNAIQLAQNGDHAGARTLLREIISEHPQLDAAWLWLATVAETREEKVQALKQAIIANPKNQQARIALGQLGEEPPIIPTRLKRVETVQPDKPKRQQSARIWMAIVGVALGTVLILFVMGQVFNFDEATSPPMTPTRAPINTLAPTTTRPTITFTPRPTNTPGPSPTPYIRATLPPSWTPASGS